MKQETIKAFELFVEKTEKLKSYDFYKFPKRVRFNWSWNQGKEKIVITGPRNQDRDGFLLTYRFFLDQNEHCSFKWLAEHAVKDSGLSDNWKIEFGKLRNDLNNYLDSFPSIKVISADYPKPMTNRNIKDLFLYGDLSHAKSLEKTEKYEQLMSNEATKGLLNSQFIDILIITFNMIIKVSDLCKSELKMKKSTNL